MSFKYLSVLFSFIGLVGCELQYFLNTPRNTSVAEGDTAVLQCQVGNLQGRVQWTKDGLTLGFDRDLPGFPNYRVLGADEDGRYNLQISSASLVDDAKYECQVGPSSGNPPIRASAYLQVQLPPLRIELLGEGSNSRVERKENEKVEIACKIWDSKPAADVIWLRNNVPIVDNVVINTTVEEGTVPGRKSVVSTIRFSARSDDNQATFACEAIHRGLRGRTSRASFLLSVQYPPERPEILGYVEGETIRMGQTVTLDCQSYGGNPLATIIWYKNDQRVDHSYTTTGSKSKNVLRFVAAADDNNAVYRCEASNIMLPAPFVAQIVMAVQFAPDTVTITAPEMARINETVTLECETSNSNPASSIQWVVGGRILPALYTRNDTSEEGGWVTKSNITFQISETDRSKEVSCYANNFALSTTKVQTHKIKVLYPPDDLTITGYSEGDVLAEGTERRIKCTAVSGNPLPTLEWFAGAVKREDAVVDKGASDSFVSSEIVVKVDRSDNDKLYQCKGNNDANPDAPVTKGFKMSVEFPPRVLNINVKPEKPVEGESAVLTCVTDTSSPGVDLRWRYNGDVLEATDSVVKPGPFGGIVTTNVLQIDVTTKHVGAVFTCEATHNRSQTTVHNSTVLTIKYRPQFSGVKKEFQIEEGKSAVLTVGVNAYPEVSLDDYTWEKDSVPRIQIPRLNRTVSGTRLAAEGGSLTFNNVVLGDQGNYILSVKNEVGTSTANIKVAILHPPRFVGNVVEVEVDEGANAELQCNVDATPLTNSTLVWKRDGYDFAKRGKVRMLAEGSLLTLFNATKADSGVFVCVANNGVPSSSPTEISEKFYLLVRHKPDIDKAPGSAKAGFNRGEKGKLVCRASGANNITFFWQKEGQQLATPSQVKQSSKYSVEVSKPDPLTWQSFLYIEDIDSSDYGEYKCVATNVLGSDEHSVVLDIKSHPDPPHDLRVLSVTYKSVSLVWQPGFDGGFKQTYTIRMKKKGSEHYFFVDVSPEGANTYEVGDLQPSSEYSFSIMAKNAKGGSNYTKDPVKATTASDPPPGSRAREISSVLSRKEDVPLIVIVVVSVAGVTLLLLNIVLVLCFVRKRRLAPGKLDGGGSSSSASSKSATIEMFVGSSYNETMGDTLSEASDRSSNYFNDDHRNRHSQDDFDDPRVRGPASTYLIDHNPIYSSRPAAAPMYSSRPPLASVYGTMPRNRNNYDHDLTGQQRFIHSLGGEDQQQFGTTTMDPPGARNQAMAQEPAGPYRAQPYYYRHHQESYNATQEPPVSYRSQVPAAGSYQALSSSGDNQYQFDLPPPPPPPPVGQQPPSTYQNIYPRYVPPLQDSWKAGTRFGDV